MSADVVHRKEDAVSHGGEDTAFIRPRGVPLIRRAATKHALLTFLSARIECT